MKKLIILLFVLVSFSTFSQLTLSEKSNLAETQTFRSRVYQGLFAKANFWITTGTPTNLKEQKLIDYAKNFVKGGGGGVDQNVMTRYWLANYNASPPDLIGEPSALAGQPSDDAILNTAALDAVFNTLAGVVAGDENLPVEP